MEKYYQQHTYAINLLFGKLDEMKKKDCFENKKIIIFGVSKITKIMISYINEIGYKVSNIIDNSCTSKTKPIMSINVSKPNELLDNFIDEALILIVSVHQLEMEKQLEDLGYEYGKHIIRVIDLKNVLDDFSYVDRKGYTELSNTEIRETQIELLRYFKKVCEENNIWYSLAYGTLLGAVRHKGYIPWDDDIDVYILIDDIKKFERVADNEKYQFIYSKNGPVNFINMGFLVDTTTVFDYNLFIPQLTTGITIDIFFIYAQPENEIFDNYFNELIDLEIDKWLSYRHEVKCLNYPSRLVNHLEMYNLEQCNYVGNLLSPYYQKDRFPKSMFKERARLLFENEMYYVMSEYEEYLKKIYGDFMKVPPENQRGGRHHYKAYKVPRL